MSQVAATLSTRLYGMHRAPDVAAGGGAPDGVPPAEA
ncbi:hypothetical protein SAMN05421678_106282 [Actinopolymorpha cephalotaxi]|uniref:Uncharacterized protein n=1 Tax=Actinopolymorpha cephalotaxi TaxID=504797 RepID=A0A1I2SMR7_9ACTN|nr:hypothetical protein [Actinopolymorpha cephalotaxi]SFG53972.1 hypothetical protein SAMN05421678_106282 [Actinopolymorpha cephalotaxi]